MSECRFGIIGIGNMGSAHAVSLFEGKVEGAILSAVADASEGRRAWASGKFPPSVEIFEDYHELLSSAKIDAVLIATPHYSHTKIAMEALEAGLHVLIEKPAGVDAAEVRLMNETALKHKDLAFGIMFNQRTNPLFGALRYYVKLGVLGEIKRFNWIINNWYRTQSYYDSAGWRASWSGEGGGVLLNQCPHNLDIWQWIMGMPATLQAFCKEGHFHDIAVEDDVTIYAEYENGASAVFTTSTGECPGTNRIEISGTMGKAVAEDGVLKLFLLDDDERKICYTSPEAMPTERVTRVNLEFPDSPNGHVRILQNFVNHILTGEELIAPGVEGINSLRISNAAYVSSWLGRKVEVPADEATFTMMLDEKRKAEGEKRAGREAASSNTDGTGKYSERWSVRW
ncbi:MAG: Gfo/Idh/MocA family oxidoreductase [Lachnospiraceae bacterium]|nr:Gfo/Idh/MocA family oxidoreductase [Lachnospiraceae bacterium]